MPRPKKAVILCKTKCGRKATENNWCGRCFAKFQKGYFTESGAVHPDILWKEKLKAERQAKRANKQKQLLLEETKEQIKQRLDTKLLKIITDQSPDMSQPKYCDALSFWTSDAICYSRLYISLNKNCARCKLHDGTAEALLAKTKELLNETTTTTTSQAETGTGGTTEVTPSEKSGGDTSEVGGKPQSTIRFSA